MYGWSGTSEAYKSDTSTNNDHTTLTNRNHTNDNDNESEGNDEMGWEYDEMIDDALEFDEIYEGLDDGNIEMYAGDEYVYGEEDDEQDSAVCSPSVNASVNASQCELSAAFASGARPQSDKARECPGRKRRIVKVTQWSASARANMIKALRERVT